MTSGFVWLNELMAWLGKWVPRILLIKVGNDGVKFGPGGSVESLAPGLHIYWPITHEVVVVSTRPRTSEINAQVHGTEVIALMVAYRVAAPLRTLTQLNDVSAYLDDQAQASLRRHHNDPDLERAIQVELAAIFAVAGVEVSQVSVIQRGPCITLKNLSDWAHHETAVATV